MACSLEKSRTELAASRARIVAAGGDTARRHIERNLHDGTQQRLVTIGLALQRLEADIPDWNQGVKERLSQLRLDLMGTLEDLRAVARGIHPAILSRGGIKAALATLARRSPVSVNIRVNLDQRLSEQIKITLYYVVSEALTNTAKYAHASEVDVKLSVNDSTLFLSVSDDGVGGANPRDGSGLIGLGDRVETLGGRMMIESPAGYGTTLVVELPVEKK
jgi:signal transduction histidine kinase